MSITFYTNAVLNEPSAHKARIPSVCIQIIVGMNHKPTRLAFYQIYIVILRELNQERTRLAYRNVPIRKLEEVSAKFTAQTS